MEVESMEYRSLGQSGLKVSLLGFGNMVSGWTPDTEAWSFECIDKCIRAGVNFLDTAELYGGGVAETVLGRNLKQGGWDRDDLIITNKLHPMCGGRQANSAKRLKAGMARGLERLQLDCVDVVFLHRFDYDTPLEEQVRVMNQFIEDEQAYYWGTSEFTPQQLAECFQICDRLGLVPPIAEQCQYNMLSRDAVERDYAPFFDECGLGTTIWSPLFSGLLTGKYNNGEVPGDTRIALKQSRPVMDRWQKVMVENREQTLTTLNKLAEIAEEVGCTQSQLAIAWTIKNPDVSTCLLGASRPAQLDETLASLDVKNKLTPEILEKIETALNNRPEPSMNWRHFRPNPPRR